MTIETIIAEVDRVLAAYDNRRQNLIPILQDVQIRLGFLPEEAINCIAKHLQLSPNEIFGVATFYAQFRFHPPGKNRITVCRGTACHVHGSARLLSEHEADLEIKVGETTPDGGFSIETVACTGACAQAPVALLNNKTHGKVTATQVKELIEELRGPTAGPETSAARNSGRGSR